MTLRHHTLEVYGAQVHLATSSRDWSRLRRKLSFVDEKPPESAGLSQFATFHPDKPGPTVAHVVLWLNSEQHGTASDLVNTIAHEAAHAASQLLDWIGHDTRGTDEPHAYLVGWLTQWMWDNTADLRAGLT